MNRNPLTTRNLSFNAERRAEQEDTLITCLARGDDRYILLYSADRKGDALKVLGKWASDPELNFRWEDAAALSPVIRNS